MSGLDDYDSLTIYLKKEGTPGFIGLHAIGMANSEWDLVTPKGMFGNEEEIIVRQKGFQAIEAWGNEYNDEHQMVGRGSFRVFSNIEDAAKEMVADGWVIFTPEVSNENN